MKRIVVLGSTGSIGTQTLDIVRQHPDRLRVVGLAAARNAERLREQAAEFDCPAVLHDEAAAQQAGVPGGMEAMVDLATLQEADVVVISVAGVIGLLPTLAAIEAGKDIALASKEVLVAGGEVVMPEVRRKGVKMLPIDSEHSAIFQCLAGAYPHTSNQRAAVEELILTASGGPFRGWSAADLEQVTVDQALNHPTWRMGGKITIDSATLMNKGLETIEAKWLFDVELGQVRVVVHPQSVVHSIVKFADGSALGQMGWPDMRLPIQVALLYPERVPNAMRPWDPTETPNLTFEPVNESAFPCLELARASSRAGKTMPCAMNAANEEAANAFLRGEIGFMDIPRTVEKVMNAHQPTDVSLESLLQTDAWARNFSRSSFALGR
ncbi:MAG: 1-deoxy-D-xylulose-5-phosphate reductoisomerase [Fimbriimonadales bacterium]